MAPQQVRLKNQMRGACLTLISRERGAQTPRRFRRCARGQMFRRALIMEERASENPPLVLFMVRQMGGEWELKSLIGEEGSPEARGGPSVVGSRDEGFTNSHFLRSRDAPRRPVAPGAEHARRRLCFSPTARCREP